jgi:hypothetical protein
MSAPAKTAPRWISPRAAAIRLGLPKYKIQKLIDRRAVEVLRLPGMRPMISAESLERLEAAAIRPAVTT